MSKSWRYLAHTLRGGGDGCAAGQQIKGGQVRTGGYVGVGGRGLITKVCI